MRRDQSFWSGGEVSSFLQNLLAQRRKVGVNSNLGTSVRVGGGVQGGVFTWFVLCTLHLRAVCFSSVLHWRVCASAASVSCIVRLAGKL